MQTDIITYNLANRGRHYTGKDRSFNCQQIAALINSPRMQEMVKSRDVLGYYGHWPRLAFGWNPAEGGILKGQVNSLEPALVTTLLEADDDGTIRHQAEFLSTNPGKIARSMHVSRVGGFSSAIDERKPHFYGFDYVKEPNYNQNRGYGLSLDSVQSMEPGQRYEAVNTEQQDGLIYLLDCARIRENAAMETIERLGSENQQYLSLLVAGGQSDTVTLDGITGHQRPVLTSTYNDILSDIQSFGSAPLQTLESPDEKPAKQDLETRRIYARLGCN